MARGMCRARRAARPGGAAAQPGRAAFALPRVLVTLLQVLAFMAKVVAMIWFLMLIRWTLPRFRYDQAMRLGWLGLFPLSIANIVLTGGALLLWGPR